MDSCELKSPSSQESGLGTMIAADDSLGSLEELTEGVHQQLSTHMDHTRLLQYELDLLRSQLAEKNKLISSQQVTIKQLHDAVAKCQRDTDDLRRIFDSELTGKSETINILQSDLTECQQQYAECFQQVVNQDCLLSELRDENAILVQKISYLETQLRKRVSDNSTQTEVLPVKAEFNRVSAGVQLRRPDLQKPERNAYRRSVQSVADFGDLNFLQSPPPPLRPPPACYSKKFDTTKSSLQNSGLDNKTQWIDHFQELMTEIRQLQEELNKAPVQPAPVQPVEHCRCHHQPPVTDIWKTMAQERQHRVQLDHNIQLLQLELIEMKNKLQSVRTSNIRSEAHCCTGHLCCACANSPLHTLV